MLEARLLVLRTSRGATVNLLSVAFPYIGNIHFRSFPFGDTLDEVSHCGH